MRYTYEVVKRGRHNDEESRGLFSTRDLADAEARHLALLSIGVDDDGRHGSSTMIHMVPLGRSVVMEFVGRHAPGYKPVKHYGVFKLRWGAPRLTHSYFVQKVEVSDG